MASLFRRRSSSENPPNRKDSWTETESRCPTKFKNFELLGPAWSRLSAAQFVPPILKPIFHLNGSVAACATDEKKTSCALLYSSNARWDTAFHRKFGTFQLGPSPLESSQLRTWPLNNVHWMATTARNPSSEFWNSNFAIQASKFKWRSPFNQPDFDIILSEIKM